MLNNDRKIGLIEETAHNPPYGPGSIRMLAVVKRLQASSRFSCCHQENSPCRGLELLMMRRWTHLVGSASFNFCLT